jgi:hypothetical protein
VWFRGKVGAVGFEKKGARGDFLDTGVKFFGVFKSYDPCERDGVAHVDQLLRLGEGPRKAVKDCLKASCVRLESGDGIFPAISLVNDDIEAELSRKIQLLLKKNRLAIFFVGICQ